MKRIARMWTYRSGKREVALGLLCLWAVISLAAFGHLIWTGNVAMMNAFVGPYTTMTMAIFTFAVAAFGMDSYTKQVVPAMGPPPRAWPVAG